MLHGRHRGTFGNDRIGVVGSQIQWTERWKAYLFNVF
jgi:hypothetical protein